METIWRKTSQLIRERGWRAGTQVSLAGKECIATGLFSAACAMDIRDESYVHYIGILVREIAPGANLHQVGLVWAWNDHPSRTEQEVHALLRRLHLKEITAFEIGEPLKEVEFEPIPESAPIEEPAPAEPVKEPQPA